MRQPRFTDCDVEHASRFVGAGGGGAARVACRLSLSGAAIVLLWVMTFPLPQNALGGDGTPAMLSDGAITAEARAFWSFQPLGTQAVPTIDDPEWSKSEIDRFLHARRRAA